jgi:predicted CoA-binding protein
MVANHTEIILKEAKTVAVVRLSNNPRRTATR